MAFDAIHGPLIGPCQWVPLSQGPKLSHMEGLRACPRTRKLMIESISGSQDGFVWNQRLAAFLIKPDKTYIESYVGVVWFSGPIHKPLN